MNLKFSTFITMYVHFSLADSVKLESQVIYERAVTEMKYRTAGELNFIRLANLQQKVLEMRVELFIHLKVLNLFFYYIPAYV